MSNSFSVQGGGNGDFFHAVQGDSESSKLKSDSGSKEAKLGNSRLGSFDAELPPDSVLEGMKLLSSGDEKGLSVDQAKFILNTLGIPYKEAKLEMAHAKGKLARKVVGKIVSRLKSEEVQEKLKGNEERVRSVTNEMFERTKADSPKVHERTRKEKTVGKQEKTKVPHATLLIDKGDRSVSLISDKHVLDSGNVKQVFLSVSTAGPQLMQVAKRVKDNAPKEVSEHMRAGHLIIRKVLEEENCKGIMPVVVRDGKVAGENVTWVYEPFESGGDYQKQITSYYSGFDMGNYALVGETLCNEVGELLQPMEALQLLHSRGVVHLDIKPANFQKTDSGLKISDFDTVSNRERVEEGDQEVQGSPGFIPDYLRERLATSKIDGSKAVYKSLEEAIHQDCFAMGLSLEKLVEALVDFDELEDDKNPGVKKEMFDELHREVLAAIELLKTPEEFGESAVVLTAMDKLKAAVTQYRSLISDEEEN